jgi:predicted transcriptional regulator
MRPYQRGVRRSILETKLDVLAAAVEPLPRTILMYRTNLSWLPMHLLIRELVDKGLLAEVDPADIGRWRSAIKKPEPKPNNRVRVLLVTTEAGLKLVEAAKEIRKALELT